MGRKTKETLEAEKLAQEERFNAAVSGKVTEMLPDLVGQILGQLNAHKSVEPQEIVLPSTIPEFDIRKPGSTEGNVAWANALALAIGNIASQGTGKAPYVAPETMERWAAARKRMMDMLIEVRDGKREVP